MTPPLIRLRQRTPLTQRRARVRVQSYERNGTVVEEVARGEHRTVTTDSDDEVHIVQVLPVEVDTVHAREVHVTVPSLESVNKRTHARLVLVVAGWGEAGTA